MKRRSSKLGALKIWIKGPLESGGGGHNAAAFPQSRPWSRESNDKKFIQDKKKFAKATPTPENKIRNFFH